MNTSTKRLVDALLDANDPRTLNPIIYRARQEYYHDYQSPLPEPISILVGHLQHAGHPELATRAMNGEFDGTREESAAWARSPEGRDTIRELGEGPARALGFPWPDDEETTP